MNIPLSSHHQTRCMAGSTYRITRISQNRPGWQIRLGTYGSDFYISEYFPDQSLGGKAKSLRAAQARRDKLMRSRAYLHERRAQRAMVRLP